MTGIRIVASVFTLALAIAPVAQASIVHNGDFEVGDFTDWATLPPPEDPLFWVSGNPHSGEYAAWFGAVGTADENIWQTFATIPGQTYELDFWLAHGASGPSNDFKVLWNGGELLNMVGASEFGYTHYLYVEVADSTSTTLRFSGRELLDFYYLDDVRVAALPSSLQNVISNPEPTTCILLGSGLALIRARRKSRSAAAGVHAE